MHIFLMSRSIPYTVHFSLRYIEILLGSQPIQPGVESLSLFLSVCPSVCPVTPLHFDRKKEQATTKKDRVSHCLTICENIVAQSLRWEFKMN